MRVAYSSVLRPIRSGQLLAGFDVNTLDIAGQRVTLVLHNVHKTASSLVLRFSLSADAHQPVAAGDLYTYGEGPKLESDTSGRFFPIELSLDITQAIRQLSGARHVKVYVNILDAHDRVHEEALVLEGVELHTEPPQ